MVLTRTCESNSNSTGIEVRAVDQIVYGYVLLNAVLLMIDSQQVLI